MNLLKRQHFDQRKQRVDGNEPNKAKSLGAQTQTKTKAHKTPCQVTRVYRAATLSQTIFMTVTLLLKISTRFRSIV